MTLGETIRTRREKLGLSQNDVAAGAMSAAYISHLEKDRRDPSVAVLEHLARSLKLDFFELLAMSQHGDRLRMRLGRAEWLIDELEDLLGYNGGIAILRQRLEKERVKLL